MLLGVQDQFGDAGADLELHENFFDLLRQTARQRLRSAGAKNEGGHRGGRHRTVRSPAAVVITATSLEN